MSIADVARIQTKHTIKAFMVDKLDVPADQADKLAKQLTRILIETGCLKDR
ncbi:hypothetical protein [Mycobacteroides abscessus]|uniref:hypothetical protein n=1 Tax=Mycobacteroides abscessus TaxID=36809 RepID=UPI0009D3583A|nr:hypothetical protein [Mycobacteroides abscessus]SKT45521.1 Uncharacterised protein [Mycobacteroides abscessus subsp. bolletii]